MQIENDYDKEVFNGDLGSVARIDDDEGALVVNFDGREVHNAEQEQALYKRRPDGDGSLVHHSDRGSQYAARAYRKLLAEHKLAGSMGRRGNPYDNAKAESFMKTALAQ